MGNNRQYRISLPQLDGGVNYAVPPHLIGDNQLSDVKNMWFKDGILQTRPGLKYVDSALDNANNVVPDKVVSFGDMAIAYGFNSGSEIPSMCFVLIDKDGQFRETNISTHSWKELEGTGVVPVAILPAQVNADAGEDVAKYDVVIYVSFSDGRVVPYGIVGHTMTKLEPYIPLVMKGGEPVPTASQGSSPNGTMLEPFNLLTDSFRCQFVSVGKNCVFMLPKKDLPTEATYTVKFIGLNDGETEHTVVLDKRETYGSRRNAYAELDAPIEYKVGDDIYHITYIKAGLTRGYFYFKAKKGEDGTEEYFNMGKSEIANNIEFICDSSNSSKKLKGVTIGTWFGGGSAGLSGGTRLFVAGIDSEPNLVRWSALNNPLYFPENNYAYVGGSSGKVTAFGKQSELLVIFKDNEIYCTQYVSGYTPTAEEMEAQEVVDIEAAAAQFPMVQLHPAIGCDCPGTVQLCNNRLVWLNSTGQVYGLFTTGQYNERNVLELSRAVERKLKTHRPSKLKVSNAAEYANHYLLNVDGTVYAMDYSSSGFTYYSSYSNDEKAQKATPWYVWDLRNTGYFHEYAKPHLLTVGQTALLLGGDRYGFPVILSITEGAKDGALDLNSDVLTGTVEISSCFKTKLYDFGYPERFKRINPFYLQISGASGETLKLTYFRENGSTEDVYRPVLTGEALNEVTPVRITPNAIRVREFGFQADCDGRMEVGSLTLNYSMMGTVR